jgi:threonine aldolase
MILIDLRSDTVTRPSKEMRGAIANAEVGDDVFGDDPTVNKLQEKCASLTGKEAALFVPTGCMANNLAIKSQTNPSDEIIVERNAHIIKYENAAPSFISGVQVMPVEGVHGVMSVDHVKSNIRPDWYHFPKTSLICLENTHNRAGGTIYPFNEIKKMRTVSLSSNIKMHLDGARIFNASVETGISVKEYSGQFDSISFCFSKGLGAPIGSILCSDKHTIEIAHRFRKVLGGGMRQAGIIAAAAIYALEHNIDRLKDDHRKARYFAEEINKLNNVEIDLDAVQTNIVIFKLEKDDSGIKKLIANLYEKGILIAEAGSGSLRAVFHMDVDDSQTQKSVEIFKTLLN